MSERRAVMRKRTHTESRRGEAGFSFIEMLAAATVLLILAAAVVPVMRWNEKRSREVHLMIHLQTMRSAIDQYKKYVDEWLIVQSDVEQMGYPLTLEELVDGVEVGDPATADSKTLRFLQSVPVDPFTGTTQWGLRSYQDDWDSRSWGGENVYDVYSLSAQRISELTKMDFRESPNHFAAQATQDAIVELSGQLKTYATSLMKIANDLRWMNSGPVAGLAEIRLPSPQPGSSTMPGKTNPVMPEMARMVAAQVMGNDCVIALSNSLGDFQLNVMLPVIAHNILQSVTMLANATRLLAGSEGIEGFEVNDIRVGAFVLQNLTIATVLNPIIGYDKAAEVVKKALEEKKAIRQVVVEMGYLSPEEANRILDPRRMT